MRLLHPIRATGSHPRISALPAPTVHGADVPSGAQRETHPRDGGSSDKYAIAECRNGVPVRAAIGWLWIRGRS
jgi:hypothetical protein